MIVDADRLSFFHKLETSLHRRSVRNSPFAVAALLDDDFVEFGKSGRVYDKRRTIELLRDDDSDFMPEVRDFQIRLLSADVVLVTYRSGRGDLFDLRSSIWRLSGGKWRMVFHQGTASTR
jgi:hypothetical protein